MKLRDIPKGEATNNAGLLVDGGYEVLIDVYCPKGKLLCWDDVAVANSMDDEITDVVRYQGKLRDIKLTWHPMTFEVRG